MNAQLTAKPTLNFWQIWNMCFGFLGIQFGFALQNSNISRIFQTLGADMSAIPILFIAAPLTGLLVQPIVGHFSDKTWNRLGRRRPYFLWGALLTTGALIFMPSSPTLWVAAGMLWILDASINVTMEPFRAFVGDMLPSKQRTFGYVMQTFFIGVGAVVASMMPWIFTNLLDVSNTAPAGQIPDSVKFSFYLGAAAVALTVGWTILRTREYSPDELASFIEPEIAAQASQTQHELDGKSVFSQTAAFIWCAVGLLATIAVYLGRWDAQLYILSAGAVCYGLIQLYAATIEARGGADNGFYEACRNVVLMPSTMRQLALVQFFSWFPLFAMWIYTTPAVTSFHYASSDPQSAAYNTGADWVGVLFAGYNGFSILAALLIPVAVKLIGLKGTHQLNLLLGAAGLASMLVIRDPHWLMLSMVGVGFAWASILSVPYAILSDALPSNKMGIYMGVFNFFIVIPQLVAASLLGLALKYLFGGEPILILGLAAGLWVVAALAMFFVKYQDPVA
ncbi:MFS transporter [Arenicella xantha]|uniref:Maltose/moltooligosaccharide transporter n=1 Tax=Arenicella xantha TaxID=644221 RepID=A0A395JIP5_9GAMM|nr:MFS transporter [Arenicella xantha]RBP49743.1 maltose/moltooligosaccharide transporter [Arenicella xantha]